jgi:hypothetical protein
MEHHDHDDRDHEHGQSSRPRQPDKYYGQRDFLLLGNWLFSVDQYFVLTDMPERKQASYVSTLLRAEALLWFRSTYENFNGPLSWQTLRANMKEYFAPPNEDRRLQDEWANLRQFGTVFEYVSVLTALAMQIRGLSDSQILDKFIRGLKPKTRIEVELRDPQSTDEAYRLADRFDRIVYGTKGTTFLTQRTSYNQYQPTSAYATVGTYGEPMQIDALRTRPMNQAWKPPFGNRRPQQPPQNQRPPQDQWASSFERRLCFNCQKPGHIASECRQPRKPYTPRFNNGKAGNDRRQ